MTLHRWLRRSTHGKYNRRRNRTDEVSSGFGHWFRASPVALSLSRLDDVCVVDVNTAYQRLFGIEREDIIGRTPLDAGIVSEVGARESAFATLRERGFVRDLELTIDSPAGRRHVLIWSDCLSLGGAPHTLSTFVDVTGRRLAEAAAHESESRLRELAEAVNEVFWLTDPDNTKMLYVSPAYERVFGRSCAQLYADARDWMQALHPDDHARMSSFVSGLAVPRPQDNRYRVVLPGGVVRMIEISTFPVLDEAGTVVRIAGVAVDVTARCQLEGDVRQAQKLESVGLLAAGVAHDFNNILGVVAANAGLLGQNLSGEDLELVDEIERVVARGAELTRQLLAFSRKGAAQPVVLDLNKVVQETRKMLTWMVGQNVTIATSLDPDLRCVSLDPGCLTQILVNLAVNARDAMPSGGALVLATRNVTRGGVEHVMLSVRDTGCGIPAEIRARIFEPFFTTKEVGKGTGLGLSVVHGIVEQAHGCIEISSELGEGTTFEICLPVSHARVAATGAVATRNGSSSSIAPAAHDAQQLRADR